MTLDELARAAEQQGWRLVGTGWRHVSSAQPDSVGRARSPKPDGTGVEEDVVATAPAGVHLALATERVMVSVSNIWNITIEVEGPREEVESLDDLLTALNDLLVILEPYDPVVIGPAPDDPSGVARYGVDLTLSTATLDEAYSWGLSVFREASDKAGLPVWPVIRMEALTNEALDASLGLAAFPALLGVAELAEVLHVSKPRASELAHSPTFPPPIMVLAAGPIWLKASVMRYVETWDRRPGRPVAAAL
jgi:hypothetical protein